MIFFRNGEVKIADMKGFIERHPEIKPYIIDENRFLNINVQTDGYGVFWNEKAAVSDRELYHEGIVIPLSLNDFINFVRYRVVSTAEACDILDCSRQNIDDLLKRGKLHPIRTDVKNKMFLKNEITQRARKKD
ncbi:MAG: DUF2442 domain-containing protein [Erysipelotrichaceae bacterium]|nr:DUF2442 domain-containing protein [Erysipelotrichaceae bacterium]